MTEIVKCREGLHGVANQDQVCFFRRITGWRRVLTIYYYLSIERFVNFPSGFNTLSGVPFTQIPQADLPLHLPVSFAVEPGWPNDNQLEEPTTAQSSATGVGHLSLPPLGAKSKCALNSCTSGLIHSYY